MKRLLLLLSIFGAPVLHAAEDNRELASADLQNYMDELCRRFARKFPSSDESREICAKFRIFLLKNADLNTKCTHGCTALHLAAYAGDQDLVQKLLNLGADPEARTSKGKAPVWYAIKNRQGDVLSLLFERSTGDSFSVSFDFRTLEDWEDREDWDECFFIVQLVHAYGRSLECRDCDLCLDAQNSLRVFRDLSPDQQTLYTIDSVLRSQNPERIRLLIRAPRTRALLLERLIQPHVQLLWLGYFFDPNSLLSILNGDLVRLFAIYLLAVAHLPGSS